MLFIFLFSLLGNSMALFLIYKKPHKMFIHWLICNLAVADLTSSIICLPLEIPLLLNKGTWIYGSSLCPILFPLQTLSVFSSVFTLVALSISRHWAIIHPLRCQPSVKHAKILIFFMWIASLICSSPMIANLKYDKATALCIETWAPFYGKVYTWILFIFQVLIPLIVMTVVYLNIFHDLKSSGEQLNTRDQTRELENKRVIRLLFILTITFIICILPCHSVHLVMTFVPTFEHDQLLISISYLLLYANNAINPILYNAINSTFRQSLRDTWIALKEKVCCQTQNVYRVATKVVLSNNGLSKEYSPRLQPTTFQSRSVYTSIELSGRIHFIDKNKI